MSHISASKYANQVRGYRRRRGLVLGDLAKLIGQSSPAHLSHWEKGRKLPSLTNALRLSAAIGCPVEILFFDLFVSIREEVFKRKQSIIQKSHVQK